MIENDVYGPVDPGVTYVAPAGTGASVGRSRVVTSTPRPSAQGFVSQPAASQMTAAPTTCLIKQYQSDGSALFQDTCTHEFAIDTLEQRKVQAAVAATPAVPAGQSCLTKQYLQDSSVLFRDVCTNEYAVATPAQRNNVVGSVDAGRPRELAAQQMTWAWFAAPSPRSRFANTAQQRWARSNGGEDHSAAPPGQLGGERQTICASNTIAAAKKSDSVLRRRMACASRRLLAAAQSPGR